MYSPIYIFYIFTNLLIQNEIYTLNVVHKILQNTYIMHLDKFVHVFVNLYHINYRTITKSNKCIEIIHEFSYNAFVLCF